MGRLAEALSGQWRNFENRDAAAGWRPIGDGRDPQDLFPNIKGHDAWKEIDNAHPTIPAIPVQLHDTDAKGVREWNQWNYDKVPPDWMEENWEAEESRNDAILDAWENQETKQGGQIEAAPVNNGAAGGEDLPAGETRSGTRFKPPENMGVPDEVDPGVDSPARGGAGAAAAGGDDATDGPGKKKQKLENTAGGKGGAIAGMTGQMGGDPLTPFPSNRGSNCYVIPFKTNRRLQWNIQLTEATKTKPNAYWIPYLHGHWMLGTYYPAGSDAHPNWGKQTFATVVRGGFHFNPAMSGFKVKGQVIRIRNMTLVNDSLSATGAMNATSTIDSKIYVCKDNEGATSPFYGNVLDDWNKLEKTDILPVADGGVYTKEIPLFESCSDVECFSDGSTITINIPFQNTGCWQNWCENIGVTKAVDVASSTNWIIAGGAPVLHSRMAFPNDKTKWTGVVGDSYTNPNVRWENYSRPSGGIGHDYPNIYLTGRVLTHSDGKTVIPTRMSANVEIETHWEGLCNWSNMIHPEYIAGGYNKGAEPQTADATKVNRIPGYGIYN